MNLKVRGPNNIESKEAQPWFAPTGQKNFEFSLVSFG